LLRQTEGQQYTASSRPSALFLHEFRRPQSHQRSHSIRIDTNDDIARELIGREAAKRRHWEFLVTASTAAVPGGTGSVLNPIATF
jgi:hypothetical protein